MTLKRIKVNKNKCTGCRMCVLSCAFKHEMKEINPNNSRIRIKKDDFQGIDLPNVCRQCKKAFCAEACPVNAIELDENVGAWILDESVCIGCGLCVEACPFKVMYMDSNKNVAIKCDLCKGEEPACVTTCPTGAIEF